MSRDLAVLPKAHLHLHLEGAMRPATLSEMAARDGVGVPPIGAFDGFAAFADMYVAACERLNDEDRLRRVVREVVEDAADDGVVWLEPSFYAPRHAAVFGSARAATEIVLSEMVAAGAEAGVGIGLIVAADRTKDPAEAEALATMAVSLAAEGEPVIGFGLANDEAAWPPEPFGPAFRIAVEGGLLSVPHGGELRGSESIIGCLEACQAHRIMHGIRCVEDQDLVKRLADDGICLDVCPTSNVMLSVIERIEDHPLPALIESGVMCSINADDPLLFGPGIKAEYELCRTALGLTDETLAQVAIWSLEASAAPADVVDREVARARRWLAG